MDPVAALTQLGGVATFGELTQVLTRHQVRHAVAGGRIEHLRRDTYALPGLDEERRAATCAGGVLGGLGAARHWGWKVRMPATRPCVVLSRNARRPARDLECHWQDLADDDVVDGVTGRAATVVACARWYDVPTALSVADSALREGVVTREQLVTAAEASPRTGRAKALAVVAVADARAANPFESCLRAHALDVPSLRLQPQGRLPGIGIVDLLDVELGIVVEAESFEFHGDKEGFRRDVRRYTACARRGLVVVRFTWEEAMFGADYVRAALADVVEHRVARGFRLAG